MKLLTRSTATGLLALGLSFGMGTTAFASHDPDPVPPAPTESLPEANKRRCVKAIERRVIDLATWSARINLRNNLTPAEKADLVGQMTTTSNGLLTVALPAVQNATTRTELKAACKAILTEYRVYLVVHPRVFITANALGWLHRITELEAKALVLHNADKDTTVIDALLLQARNLATPIPASIAGVTPASYNADPAGTKILFHGVKGTLKTVELDVKAAAKLIRKLNKP